MDFEKCDINSKVLILCNILFVYGILKGSHEYEVELFEQKLEHIFLLWENKLKLYIINGEGKRGSWYHKICHYN